MFAIISHPNCLLHNAKLLHPECPERLKVISNALLSADFGTDLLFIEAPPATEAQLHRVHDKKYVESLFQWSPKEGFVYLDEETILGPHTVTAALHAAGAVVKAVDLLLANQAKAAFCNVRPPGHHAEPDKAMGFCFFNNVAVGVAHALSVYGLERIAIIDFDVHRGNGTEAIFFNQKKVHILSIYEENLYPLDDPKKAKNILKIPLPFDATGREFRTEVMHGLTKINAFKPQMVFFSAGFDGHGQDSISSLNLNERDYLWITQQVKQIATAHSQGRMVSVLEGGYALNVLGDCVKAHIQGLIQ